MFATAVPFVGIRPNAVWAADFQTALNLPETIALGAHEAILASNLDIWARASAELAADAGYQAAERYCIRQSFLWKMYAAFEALGFGEQVAPVILDRALDVLAETPVAAQPENQHFLEEEPTAAVLLEHLRAVGRYYARAVAREALDGLESFGDEAQPPIPPTSPGFLCTMVLKPNMDADLARQFWQQFMAQNTVVRLITLGNDGSASEAVEIADPILFSPGGAQKPGRCLWAQPAALLPDVHQWLREQGYAPPETARCIFVRADGTLSAVLKKTDNIDDFAISDEFFNAC